MKASVNLPLVCPDHPTAKTIYRYEEHQHTFWGLFNWGKPWKENESVECAVCGRKLSLSCKEGR